jgi:hypothetical protein
MTEQNTARTPKLLISVPLQGPSPTLITRGVPADKMGRNTDVSRRVCNATNVLGTRNPSKFVLSGVLQEPRTGPLLLAQKLQALDFELVVFRQVMDHANKNGVHSNKFQLYSIRLTFTRDRTRPPACWSPKQQCNLDAQTDQKVMPPCWRLQKSQSRSP